MGDGPLKPAEAGAPSPGTWPVGSPPAGPPFAAPGLEARPLPPVPDHSPVAATAEEDRTRTKPLELTKPGQPEDLAIDAATYFANLDVRPGSPTLATHHQVERDLLRRTGTALRVVGDPKSTATAKQEAAKLLLYTAMMLKSTHEGYWAGTLRGEDITPYGGAAATDPDARVLQREERTVPLLQAAQQVLQSPRIAGFITISQARVEQLRTGAVTQETFARISRLIHEDKVFSLTTALTGLHGLTPEQQAELAALSRGVIRQRMLSSVIPFMHSDQTTVSANAPYGREGALVAIGDALILDVLRRGEWSFAAGQNWKFAEALYRQAQRGFPDTPADRPVWEYAPDVATRLDAIGNLKARVKSKDADLADVSRLLSTPRAVELRSCAACHGQR